MGQAFRSLFSQETSPVGHTMHTEESGPVVLGRGQAEASVASGRRGGCPG